MNVALVAPAAIDTVAGTVALALLEASDTESPPVGAGFESVTVPLADPPPSNDVGLSVTLPIGSATRYGFGATTRELRTLQKLRRLLSGDTAIELRLPVLKSPRRS